ncbi:4'-phosphopantetheinyl transferase family protein [Reichenbachiella ulvae]|uniref:Enterobactin synthase component D n=1 Tax=Reichenbachiella ulvae TaxID=2980104 RepID=A0ABT3D0T9_9BACT|nr:4'-phosphopantetheinyl transferase superfamily protein [Reichenbachiella ulvae]MCV9389355.1 4'-phosphopantetheinyl transferase superfamily protein [Reichenbachiella ulvae]
MIDIFLPEEARACFTNQNLGAEVLHAEELSIYQNFEPTRQLDFCRGRYSAHQCLEHFGADAPILKDQEGAPIWPEGYSGSISHTNGMAGAMVTKNVWIRSVGLDLERIGRITRELWQLLFTPREINQLNQCYPEKADFLSTLFFSIKEAFYKMQFAISRQFMGFHDCEIVYTKEKCHLSPLVKSTDALYQPSFYDIHYHRHDDLIISYVLLRHDKPKHEIDNHPWETNRHDGH